MTANRWCWCGCYCSRRSITEKWTWTFYPFAVRWTIDTASCQHLRNIKLLWKRKYKKNVNAVAQKLVQRQSQTNIPHSSRSKSLWAITLHTLSRQTHVDADATACSERTKNVIKSNQIYSMLLPLMPSFVVKLVLCHSAGSVRRMKIDGISEFTRSMSSILCKRSFWQRPRQQFQPNCQ